MKPSLAPGVANAGVVSDILSVLLTSPFNASSGHESRLCGMAPSFNANSPVKECDVPNCNAARRPLGLFQEDAILSSCPNLEVSVPRRDDMMLKSLDCLPIHTVVTTLRLEMPPHNCVPRGKVYRSMTAATCLVDPHEDHGLPSL